MLTNLDFLDTGQQWPPASEVERLQQYEDNRLLFEGKHEQVFTEWIKILRDDRKALLELILNWYKRLSLLWADLLLGEPPTITVGEDDSPEQINLHRIIEDNSLILSAHEVAIDISRFGVGLFKVRYDTQGIIEAQPPMVWFPVVQPDNIKQVIAHVLAYEFEVDKVKYLKAEIHEKGKITTKIYFMRGGYIGELAEEPKEVQTGVNRFLIIPTNNVMTSDRLYGKDDYEDLDSIIQELEIRVAQVSKILDKHADPNMYGPSTAMSQTSEGEWEFQGGGKYFPVDEGESTPGYITWDGQIDAAFKQIEILLEQLYILSETSAAAFGQLKAGLAESGTALRRLMMAPLAKTNRIRMRFDPTLKNTLKACSELEVSQGMSGALVLKNIDISWQDGLPDDDREQADIYALYRQNGLISIERGLKQLFKLKGAQLKEELDRLLVEANEETPGIFKATNLLEDGDT